MGRRELIIAPIRPVDKKSGEIALTDNKQDEAGTITLSTAARLSVLFGGTLATYAMLGLTPVLPAIKEHFHDTPNVETLTGMLISIIALMNIFGSVLAGYLADRFGRRLIILLGVAMYGIAGVSGFFLENLLAILGTRIFVGLGMSATSSLGMAIVVTNSTGLARSRWIGYVAMFPTLMAVALTPFAGYIGSFSWKWPFLVHFIAAPLFVLMYFGLVADKPRQATPAATSTGSVPTTPDDPLFPVVAMARLACLSFVLGILMATYVIYVPFHVDSIGITDPKQIGYAVTAVILTTGLSSYAHGRIRAYLSMEGTLAAALGILAIGFMLTALSQSYVFVLASLVLAGLGNGQLAPCMFAFASVTGPDSRRGQAIGIARGSMYAGPLAGQLILDYAGPAFGKSIFKPIPDMSNAGAALFLLGVFAAIVMLVRVVKTGFGRSAAA